MTEQGFSQDAGMTVWWKFKGSSAEILENIRKGQRLFQHNKYDGARVQLRDIPWKKEGKWRGSHCYNSLYCVMVETTPLYPVWRNRLPISGMASLRISRCTLMWTRWLQTLYLPERRILWHPEHKENRMRIISRMFMT